MSRYWYVYDGSGDEGVIGSYILPTTPIDPDNCAGGTSLCLIYAPAGGLHPSVVSSSLQSYFGPAKINQTFGPNAAGQKAFVYTRPS